MSITFLLIHTFNHLKIDNTNITRYCFPLRKAFINKMAEKEVEKILQHGIHAGRLAKVRKHETTQCPITGDLKHIKLKASDCFK